MKVFGPHWAGTENPLHELVPTPEGARCMHCDEDIIHGSSGSIMPYTDGNGTMERAIHLECLGRQVLGSVGHQKKKCACYGGHEEDDPKLTKREAALAAVRFYQNKSKADSHVRLGKDSL